MRTDERREQLLRCGVELLGRRSHEDVSIEEIAASAGVSTGLLYHYFPTKADFLIAALREGQRQLLATLAPRPGLDPAAQLDASLEAFLDYVEEHATAYRAVVSGSTGNPQIADALKETRRQYMDQLIAALGGREASALRIERSPALEAAMQGWLFFVDGAVLRWLEGDDLDRTALRAILSTALGGALRAAQAGGARLTL